MSCIFLQIRGDWPAICERFGFPTWGSSVRPCYRCNGVGAILYDQTAVSALGVPWRPNTDDDWEVACARCERWVSVTAAQHRELVLLLGYDKRDAGSHGLALKQSYLALGLEAGDRLEPHQALLDVGLFEK